MKSKFFIIIFTLISIFHCISCSAERKQTPINLLSQNEDLYSVTLNSVSLDKQYSFSLDITKDIKILLDDNGDSLCICNTKSNILTFIFHDFDDLYDSLGFQILFGKFNTNVLQTIKKLQYCYLDSKTLKLEESKIGIFSIKIENVFLNNFLNKGGDVYLCNNKVFSLKNCVTNVKEVSDYIYIDDLDEIGEKNDVSSAYKKFIKMLEDNYKKLKINDVLISFFALSDFSMLNKGYGLNAHNEDSIKNKYRISLRNNIDLIVDYECFSILFGDEKKVLLLSKAFPNRDGVYSIKDAWNGIYIQFDDRIFEKYKKIGASVYTKTNTKMECLVY